MIIIHKSDEFIKMRAAGKLAAVLLQELGSQVKIGITTKFLDEYAKKFIEKHKTKSACFGYKGRGSVPFPAQICTCVNHVICHGIPSDYELQNGDIIAIDVTLIVDGYHGDTCATFPVGEISTHANDLIKTTFNAMHEGINAAQSGAFIGDIGAAIQKFIGKRYAIVEDYCGHGIGLKFHQEPEISHVGVAKTGSQIKEGMFFTVEPMINIGKKSTRVLNDGWTVITSDYSLSAQFEHTVLVGPNGPEISTLP